MPLYEYLCEKEDCKHITTLIRKFSEQNEPVQCEKCQSEAKVTLSSNSFQLKGGGWAADNYRFTNKGRK